MNFSGFLAFPVSSQLERPVELKGPGMGAINGAATAIPAFFRVQNDRRLAFLRMRYVHVYRTCFYTGVAPVAYVRIK
jgi:hypothetical protein